VAENTRSGRSPARPGAVLRSIRARRGWTLSEVSARTRLSVSTLSKIENDKIALTYDKLARLSEGLDIDISRLFGSGGDGEESPVVASRRSVTRAGEGKVIETRNYGHLYPAADLLKKRFIPIIAEIRARSVEEFGELIRHHGEEYAFVIEGEVDLHTDVYAPMRLAAGDSIYFDSGMGHAYIAASPGPCRVLSICSAPEAVLIAAVAQTGAEEAEPEAPVRRKLTVGR
jgi:transcriptional regulator with XRE-family HTH domain